MGRNLEEIWLGNQTKFFTRRRWRVKIQIGQENEMRISDEEKENESRICDLLKTDW